MLRGNWCWERGQGAEEEQVLREMRCCEKWDAEKNEMLREMLSDELMIEMLIQLIVWVISHLKNPQVFSFVPKSFFLIVETIRLLDSTGITTFNRVDVAFRHVTSRCKHVAMNQVALRDSNRDRTQRCTRYWCFSNWLIISNEIKFFENKSIDRESVVWWRSRHKTNCDWCKQL